jgi:ribosomal protein L11 methylase PrmA
LGLKLTSGDMQHHVYSLCYDGKLFTCPIDKDFKVHRVLDVGTGTGIWAIDYGKPRNI